MERDDLSVDAGQRGNARWDEGARVLAQAVRDGLPVSTGARHHRRCAHGWPCDGPQAVQDLPVACRREHWRHPGYDRKKHEALADSIATPGSLVGAKTTMACHGSAEDAPTVCVGWLHNQLGPGNNLGLRLRAIREPELGDYTLAGKQRASFAETFHSAPRRAKGTAR